MEKLTLKELPLQGKRVLMRVDFNVPINKNGQITDASRIAATLPSIRYILDKGAALILMSHLGRPKGAKIPALSLTPCAKKLSQLLGIQIKMAPDCIGKDVEKLAAELKPGEVLMLENLRFHPGEEQPNNYPDFVTSLAALGDEYVNDAFASAHRYHASTAAIAQYFPGKAAAGFLLENEVDYLDALLKNPERPFCALIGGAKISSKIGTLRSLLNKVDLLLIGGAMAFTFLKAQGFSVGNSLCEEDQLVQARQLLEESEDLGTPLILPSDIVITQSNNNKIVDVEKGIPSGWSGVDIGPKTIARFKAELQTCKTVFWNGPVGVFEIKAFAKGTMAIAKIVANLQAKTVVGGGDSLAAVKAAGVADKISHLSTGGGATLEYLEFGTLPGIEALTPSPTLNKMG